MTIECWVKVRSKPGMDPRIMRCIGPTEGPCPAAGVDAWEIYVCKASACPPGAPGFALQHNPAAPAPAVPGLSSWGGILAIMAMAGLGATSLRRRRRTPRPKT